MSTEGARDPKPTHVCIDQLGTDACTSAVRAWPWVSI